MSALVLDFGGVLTSDLWESVRGCALRSGLRESALIDLLNKDEIVHQLFVGLERGDVGQRDFEAALGSAASIPADGLLSRMCADLRPNLAMLDAVDRLRHSGNRIGVLSNTWGSGYFNPYRGYDLARRADAVILSDQVRMRKPEPEIFQLMLEKLGVDAVSTVFVDDVATHLSGAKGLGFETIHHVSTDVTLSKLEEHFGVSLS